MKRGPTDHEQRILLVANWLKRYASIYSLYGKTLKDYPDKFDEFLECFKDVAPADVDYAFERTRAEYEGPEFPTPAEVMKRLRARQEEANSFEAEKAWADVRWVIGQFWYGSDLGLLPLYVSKQFEIVSNMKDRVVQTDWNGGFKILPKPFDARTDFAIRNVGGLQRIAEAGPKEHDFIRRDFINAHQRFSETAGYLAPSREEAKRIMDGLKKGIAE